ncbi:MAG TPA: transcription elongation factor GreA, partial [Dehalococcoidia bacterium]
MPGKPVPLTKDGLDKLQKELDELVTSRRAEVAQKIHDAKELVGAQNSPEYE